MILKFKKLYLFSLLFLLQSCSGGRLGNFLESSFKNNDKSKITYSGNNKEENNLGIDAVNKNLVNQNLKKNIKNKETDLLSEKKMDINNNEANLLSEKKTNIQNKDGITSDRKITFNKNREQINIKKRGKSNSFFPSRKKKYKE